MHVPDNTARGRDEDLRDDYLARRLEYPKDPIICIEESSCECTVAVPKKIRGPKEREVAD